MAKKDAADAAVDEVTPTLEEGKAMFAGNPGLDSVVTTDGKLFRDGRLEALPVA